MVVPPGEVCDDRQARLALSCVTEPGDRDLLEMVAAEGAESVWRSLSGVRWATRWGRRVPTLGLEDVRAAMVRHDLRFVVPGDDEWPEGFEDLADTEWKRFGGRPLGVWISGPGHLREWATNAIAIVGSRACTSYGQEIAGEFAADLASDGVTVVSGGAYGIDISAHRGALAVGGRTIAVLAGGADRPYPRGNARTIGAIRDNGLVVSEAPPGGTPSRLRFLSRNRLIAGLGQGIVVVEAGHRSGAKNTVTWAGQCLRIVMAIPGPVTSAYSAGTHQMIREGAATLVSSVAEIRELIAPMGQDLLPIPQGSRHAVDALGDVQREVFDVVPGRGGRMAGDLALRCGRDLLTTLTVLEELEEMGFVQYVDEHGWKLRPGSVG